MIPQRVKLSGFLSYKDEQEIPFAGASVWMLAGTNGSGKSSIFDAVTYALFGHHRGGSQNAIELINKDSTSLAVEFDFTSDGVLFRIRRTLKRSAKGTASGTQQIFRSLGGDDWEAVEDTNKKVDFDKWVHEHIGLTYETFTSSVLLLQGKAEKLLDSKPSGRAEVLAGIVDLERYQRLYERANQKKLALKGQLEALSHQQSAVPEVSEFEYAAAVEAIDSVEDERLAAQRELDALRDLEVQSRKWADAQTRLAATREKLRQAESLLGSAVKIEKAFARMAELKDALPAASAVVTTRAKLLESERKTERLQRDRDDATERRTLADNTLSTAKQKRETLKKQRDKDEETLAKTVARLRELAGVLRSVELAEEQETRVTNFDKDLSKLPADPASEVRTAQDELDRLQELGRVLPVLQRVHDERTELKGANQRQQVSQKRADEIKVLGETKRDAMKKLADELADAKAARAAADERAAGAAVLARQAKELLAEFSSLTGEKSCRACGQPLTPQHFEEEKSRRTEEAKVAEQKLTAATTAQRAATAREKELHDREQDGKAELDKLREDYKDADTERKQAAADITRHLKTLKLAYAELPPYLAKKISPSEPADWPATAFPARDELARMNQDAAGLDAARRTLRAATDTLDKWKQLRAERDAAKQTLAKLKASLPKENLLTLREESGNLQAGETSLQNAIRSTKTNLGMIETEIDRLGRESHAAVTTLTEIVGKFHTEDVTRTHCRETIDREMRKLDPAWQMRVEKAGMAEYHGWKAEYDDLVAADTEVTYRKLEVARGGLDAIRGEIRRQETEANEFPETARLQPDEVKQRIATARGALDEKDKELRDAQRRKSVFDGHREQRTKLGEQWKAAEAEFNRFKILSELLGRDRLQRHLVRQAERQIVDYGNAVLDRLSGGQLFLKLVGGDEGAGTDRALDLECYNRTTGGAPINVLFLSGSQKFRVAVSLALGIGQYASRQHRPIESVIIDEGFGCLDRQGRQVMIQELQNLRGHLHCILLVSHQEEFAEAFNDGYHFSLENGATRVKRFQR